MRARWPHRRPAPDPDPEIELRPLTPAELEDGDWTAWLSEREDEDPQDVTRFFLN